MLSPTTAINTKIGQIRQRTCGLVGCAHKSAITQRARFAFVVVKCVTLFKQTPYQLKQHENATSRVRMYAHIYTDLRMQLNRRASINTHPLAQINTHTRTHT